MNAWGEYFSSYDFRPVSICFTNQKYIKWDAVMRISEQNLRMGKMKRHNEIQFC